MKGIAKERLGGGVSEALAAEVNRQRAVSGSVIMLDGVLGLFEMATMRQMLLGNYPFLPQIARYLDKIIRSFSQIKTEGDRREGLANLQTLVQQVGVHQQTLLKLSTSGSPTCRMISELHRISCLEDSGKNVAISALYEALKKRIVFQCQGDADVVGVQVLLEFARAQAQQIHDGLPGHLTGSTREVGSHVAKTFALPREGGGALLSGTMGAGMFVDGHVVGDGLPSGATVVQMSGFHPELWPGLDPKDADRIKTHAMNAAQSYWERKELLTGCYTIIDSQPIWHEIQDPRIRAGKTIAFAASYRVEQVAQEAPFGLDANQRERLLGPERIKAIIFGIDNDVFTPDQIKAVLEAYSHILQQNLTEDVAIQAACSRAITRCAAAMSLSTTSSKGSDGNTEDGYEKKS